MLPLRYAQRWRLASGILLLLVLGAAIMPAMWDWVDRASLLSWLHNLDKWTHTLTFAVLSLWFAGQYKTAAYWRIAAGLLGFGVLIEVCQRAVGYRSAEWMDIGADVVGIFAGLTIALLGAGGWCQAVEARIARRRTRGNDLG